MRSPSSVWFRSPKAADKLPAAWPTTTASSARSWPGDLPAEKVAEDEHTVAFMDINPWTRGHALVIPREHSRNLYEISDDDLAQHPAAPPSAWPSACATGWTPTA